MIAAAQPANAAGGGFEEARNTAAAIVRVTGTGDVVQPGAGDRDSVAVAHTDVGTVDVPMTTQGKVSVENGGSPVQIGLPDITTNRAVRHTSGTLVYADESAPADVAVQPTKTGVRALVTLKDESASRVYRFPISGPKGSRLLPAAQLLGADNDTGEVLLVGAHNEVLGTFAAAWAKDARGRPVATRYQVQGNTLVQVVDVPADTAFPVVADPSFWQILACAGALGWLVGTNVVVPLKIARIKRYESRGTSPPSEDSASPRCCSCEPRRGRNGSVTAAKRWLGWHPRSSESLPSATIAFAVDPPRAVGS